MRHLNLPEQEVQRQLAVEFPHRAPGQLPILEENRAAIELFEMVCTEWEYYPNGRLAGLDKLAVDILIKRLELDVPAAVFQQLLTMERVIRHHVSSTAKRIK